jgi:hypothetical protein
MKKLAIICVVLGLLAGTLSFAAGPAKSKPMAKPKMAKQAPAAQPEMAKPEKAPVKMHAVKHGKKMVKRHHKGLKHAKKMHGKKHGKRMHGKKHAMKMKKAEKAEPKK